MLHQTIKEQPLYTDPLAIITYVHENNTYKYVWYIYILLYKIESSILAKKAQNIPKNTPRKPKLAKQSPNNVG